ncbi:MAG: GntR family transcriptional regulator [Acetobacteraceae bacterium]
MAKLKRGEPAAPAVAAAPAAGAEGGTVIDWPRLLAATKEHQVAEFLRERIISGQLGRGQKLKQDEIARSLNISITPVREALKLLEAQGYVVGYSHRGVIVAPFEIEKAKELFELRLLLEGGLTRIAAANATAGDLRGLHELNQEIVQAASSGVHEKLRRANYRFHFRLYELARRPQTLEFVRVLWAKYPFDLVGVIPGRFDRANAEHGTVLKALTSGDARKTMRAMQVHIESNWREFKATYPLYRSK